MAAQDRKWTVDFRDIDPETGEWDVDEETAAELLQRTFSECAVIQHREGGAFILMPIRQQLPPVPGSLSGEPRFVNLGVEVQHKYAPAIRPQPQAAPPLPEPEPVPTDEGEAAAAEFAAFEVDLGEQPEPAAPVQPAAVPPVRPEDLQPAVQ